MKDIVKGKEPPKLTQHRQQGGRFSDAGDWKDAVKESLLREQGELCCYCMRRISGSTMKIEHWCPQSVDPGQELAYRNLLAACPGNQSTPRLGRLDIRHCDTQKGDRPLRLNPVAGVERLLRYDFTTGHILSDDTELMRELGVGESADDEATRVGVLNLNGVVVGLLEALMRRHPTGDWTVDMLQRELDRWRSRESGRLREYCQVAVEFLRQRIERARRRQARK